MVQEDHPPFEKANETYLRLFPAPDPGAEYLFRFGILKKLPVGAKVAIISGKFAGKFGTMRGYTVRRLMVDFDGWIEWIPFEHVICEEIYESKRIACLLQGKEFCPLAF